MQIVFNFIHKKMPSEGGEKLSFFEESRERLILGMEEKSGLISFHYELK
jgi:hypothetical protein